MKPDHRPELDGLRALAVTLVLLHHAAVPGFGGGAIGVDLFFVLSGFLITRILLTQPTMPNFWERRSRRIIPALIPLCAAYALAAPFVPRGIFAHPWLDLLGAATFTTDYLIPRVPGWNGLGHTWSLAVEMQFYMLWPFVLRALTRAPRSVAAAIFAALYLAIWSARVAASAQGWEAANFPLHTHAGGLVLGSAVAFFPRLQRSATPLLGGLLAIGAIFAICLGGSVVGNSTGAWFMHMVFWATPAAEVAGAVLLVSLRQPSALQRAFAWPPARALGLISYGVYLWHFPIAIGLRDQGWPVRLIASASVAISIAALSFVTIERWGRSFRLAAPSRQAIFNSTSM